MDNKAVANIFYETADLMEVRGDDSFRIRSYRRAAEALEGLAEPLADLCHDEKALLAIPGIGKAMAGHIRDVCTTGKLSLHEELLTQFRPSMLELLKIQGLGPKTIALIWDAFQVCDPEGVEKLAREGKLRTLPRLSEKSEQKIIKAVENYRQLTGRFLLDTADEIARKMAALLKDLPGVEKVTPAGSLRRGRETVGDLDLLVTGHCCASEDQRNRVIEEILNFPGILEVLAKGENKVSFRLRSGLQVDVRLLPPDSFGAALQYFTGSKNHNVSLRQRALRQGYTLNEYGLARVEDNQHVAGKTEEEIYNKLGLRFIPPELRENNGEIEAAEEGTLPELITEADLQGDVHMHTVETDGKCTIEEMALAARDRGYKYMAITDHSKASFQANGLDAKRLREQIAAIKVLNEKIAARGSQFRLLTGSEVDILKDRLDFDDDVLAELEVVVASLHVPSNNEAENTKRLIRAAENPHVHMLGHLTGRLLLEREPYPVNVTAVIDACADTGTWLELNCNPWRFDLDWRLWPYAKSKGVKCVINPDAHRNSHASFLRLGAGMARKGWLEQKDVLNILNLKTLYKELKRKGDKRET